MSNSTHWKWRIGIAVVAGLLIFGIALTTINAVQYPAMRGQRFTIRQLQFVGEQIKTFRKNNSRLPRSLKELNQPPYDLLERQLKDTWGHPFSYTVHGDRYTLISYGMDRKPGGTGLDYDLTAASPKKNLPAPTFRQLFFLPASAGVRFSAAFFGLLTFLLILDMLQASDFTREGNVNLAAKLFFTLLAASMVAFFITVFHVPSGH